MRTTIDGAAFGQMILHAAASINAQKQSINDLNVFPVPDGDTGTNMSLTIGTAAAELKKQPLPAVSRAAEVTASALLRGARGNSGVILSLLFRGFSKAVKDRGEIDGGALAAAFSEGVTTAYGAVMKPAEGTILTVSRLAAKRAVEAAAENASAEYVLVECIAAAKAALAETINQNPVLKKAGVIDAGGKGYVIILEGMLAALRGEAMPEAAPEGAAPAREKADFAAFDGGDIRFGYCTEFIAQRKNQKDPRLLRAFLSELGDSLVLVDDEEIIKVHVHTNHPGRVLEEALGYGSLLTVKVENMREQHTEILEAEVASESDEPAEPEKKYGFVAVCAGEGLAAVFTDLGCDGIIQGGQTMNPSTEDILKVIERTPSEIVYVLPNNKNIIMAAEQCIPLAHRRVIVVPTKTVPQGIAAMLAVCMESDEEANTAAMLAAAEKVKTAQITYAARDSEFDGADIHAGDYLALLGGQLFGTDRSIQALLTKLAAHLAEGRPEFINIFYGEDVSAEDAESARRIFEAACPSAELGVLSGGQPVYYYTISAE
ncbi:MAG TPA: DAK2 domain-containing protein [Oscillospiraceae bacterium]|nr:DAK2 domain-containing protein [Oscillospiraceae bacterium]